MREGKPIISKLLLLLATASGSVRDDLAVTGGVVAFMKRSR